MQTQHDSNPLPTIDFCEADSDRAVLKKQIESAITEAGCALVRSHKDLDAKVFRELSLLSCSELVEDNGEHSRQAMVSGVFSPTEYSAQVKLLWHNENTFLDVFPARIVFGCKRAALQGGETPVLDGEELLGALSKTVARKFRDCGILYLRTYVRGLHRSWQEILRASSQAEAEAYCAEHKIRTEWRGNTLVTRSMRPAVVVHPDLGREIFAAQPLHWHPRALEADVRESLVEFYGPDGIPRNCFYGDGTPIEDSIIDDMIAIGTELERSFRWQAGDVMVVDNVRCSHARNAYEGPRELLVAMGPLVEIDSSWSGGSSNIKKR